MVATGTISGVTATTALIDSANVAITPSSTLVNDASVDYSITLTVTHPVPIGGFFTIYIPE